MIFFIHRDDDGPKGRKGSKKGSKKDGGDKKGGKCLLL